MSTRSKTKSKSTDSSSANIAKKANATYKIFFFKKQLITEHESLHFVYFYHPGKSQKVLFVSEPETRSLYELKEYAEPHRSWLIDSTVCSNGKVYFTIPFDSTFLVIYYLKKYCSQKAMSLDNIIDDNDASVHEFLTTYSIDDNLSGVADIKSAAGMKFYKYSPTRTLAWLAVKIKKLASHLKTEKIYSGFSSLSLNYKKSEADQNSDDDDYLRNACDIIGSYVESSLLKSIQEYLGISDKETKAVNNKRKSSNPEESSPKKFKTEDTSFESPKETEKSSGQKEKKLTAKAKALAKGAKGTKSISSFFKK